MPGARPRHPDGAQKSKQVRVWYEYRANLGRRCLIPVTYDLPGPGPDTIKVLSLTPKSPDPSWSGLSWKTGLFGLPDLFWDPDARKRFDLLNLYPCFKLTSRYIHGTISIKGRLQVSLLHPSLSLGAFHFPFRPLRSWSFTSSILFNSFTSCHFRTLFTLPKFRIARNPFRIKRSHALPMHNGGGGRGRKLGEKGMRRSATLAEL